ncbi:MAG: hypothetical protein GX892_12760 [Thermoanaerobacteraceae bacterium]|nr:hypothetical protein [Thermoanaerobacteraceae bacterium]
MIWRVLSVVAVVIIVSLIRGAGYQMGFIGWCLSFGFIIWVFQKTSKKNKKDDQERNHPRLDGE